MEHPPKVGPDRVSPLTGGRLTQGEAVLFNDGYTSTTAAEHSPRCYICRDPDFAQMGLPRCRTCDECSKRGEPKRPGHVPADDTVCTICGTDEHETPEFAEWEAQQEANRDA
jgi:hypothetical protein